MTIKRIQSMVINEFNNVQVTFNSLFHVLCNEMFNWTGTEGQAPLCHIVDVSLLHGLGKLSLRASSTAVCVASAYYDDTIITV